MKDIGTICSGVICSWFPPQKFGFIQIPEVPDELFFHKISVISGQELIAKGAGVEFETGVFKDRPVAVKVRVLASDGSAR